MVKKAALLIHLGTPDAPDFQSVKRYLTEFLLDPDVLDLPWLQRQILVRGVIVPRRHRVSAISYQEIWMPEGSPLKVYTRHVAEELQKRLQGKMVVKWAMRYQNPSIESVLESLQKEKIDHLTILPLFPQYAGATSGSIIAKVKTSLNRLKYTPKLNIIPHFYALEKMIEVFASHGKSCLEDSDHVLISFHGLPKRQADKGCYLSQCYLTAGALATQLKLKKGDYTVCFQSRLGKEKWIEPYTSDALKTLAKAGKKRLAVFSPSFTSDCLETLYEIGKEYQHEFEKEGGEKLLLVKGLNDDPLWITALEELLTSSC